MRACLGRLARASSDGRLGLAEGSDVRQNFERHATAGMCHRETRKTTMGTRAVCRPRRLVEDGAVLMDGHAEGLDRRGLGL